MKTLNRKRSILLVGGLDSSLPGEYLKDQSTPNSQNFYIDKGILRKRPGTTAFGTSMTEEIMAGREFLREGSIYNVRIGLDKVHEYSGGAWNNITGTDLTGTTADSFDLAVPVLSGQPILCFTNGIDAIRKWTGTGNTANLGGTPPVAKFIQEYKTYLVCANIAGGTDVSNRVQWSDTANPEEWVNGNAGAVDLIEDGDEITGMDLFGDYLCIHKSSSIYLGSLVSSTSIFRFNRYNTKSGTVCNATIRNLPTNEQIFLSNDGLRIFNGSTAELVDSPINEEIRDGLNLEYVHKCWSVLVREQNEVWIACPIGSQTTPDTIYRFNYLTRKTLKDSRVGITAAWRFTQNSAATWDSISSTWDDYSGSWNDSSLSNNAKLIMIGNSSGQTYKVDDTTANDGSSAVSAFFETKDFQSDEIGQIARWLYLELWAKGSSVKVEYSTDSGNTWVEAQDSPFTLSDDYPADDAPLMVYFDVVNSKIRFKFSNSELGESLSIKQFWIGYRPRELRQ